MRKQITTLSVCRELNLTETGLRHLLRRPDAPRPELHPSARLFLWTEADVARLSEYLEGLRKSRAEKRAGDGA